MTDTQRWTEEDTKTKVILPFFTRLGFAPSDIRCEVTKSFRFGRTVYRADDNSAVTKAVGRIDLLVSLPDAPNLILVEAKRDDSPITREDIEQGLSYSKAVEPYPPVTMITNGKDWRIFDSRSNKEITEGEVNGYEVGLKDAERYYKAIRRLITLSKKNLDRFCNWQVREHVRPFLGSTTDRTKKYIPALFHEPEALAAIFKSFLESSNQAFVLTGRSGDGKSCWMCHRAVELLDLGWNVFFFRGLDARKGIAGTLANQIQAQLGPLYTPIEAMRRVSEVTERAIVFVDGLDEISPDLAREITSKFVRNSTPEKVLRLVVSCKSTGWPQLKEVDSVSTPLWETVRATECFYELPTQWEPSDFEGLVKKYRDFYRCSARFGDKAYQEVQRSPYLLRLLFEEAEGKDESSLLSIDSKNLYDTMLANARSRLREKVPNFEEILTAIAKVMVENNTESLEESTARSALGLRITEELPPALFEMNILERDYVEDDTPLVRFYFGRMRDFLVGFNVLRWPKMDPEKLKESVSSIGESTVLRDALELFYSLAKENQKRVLDETIYHYGVAFLEAFVSTLYRDFTNLKSKLVHGWEESAELGFVGEIMLTPLALRMEGVQVRREGTPEILLVPSNGDRKRAHYAGIMRGGGSTGEQGKAESSASRSLWSGVKGLIGKYDLDESENPLLMKERVLAFHADRYTSVLGKVPKTVGASRWKILFEKAMRNQRHLFRTRLEESGECEVTWKGPNKGISYRLPSPEEEQAMLDVAYEMASSGQVVFTKVFANSTREEEQILRYLAKLESLGIESLTDEPLFSWYTQPFSERTHENTVEILHWIANNLVPAYKRFVKQNFPNHWKQFPFVVNPRKVVLFIDGREPDACLDRWVFRSTHTKMEVVDSTDHLPVGPPPYPPDFMSSGRCIHVLPRHYGASGLSDDLNLSFCLLHKLIYDQVLNDLKETLPDFAELPHMGAHTGDFWF